MIRRLNELLKGLVEGDRDDDDDDMKAMEMNEAIDVSPVSRIAHERMERNEMRSRVRVTAAAYSIANSTSFLSDLRYPVYASE